jgi:putative FmdB family regulatory protein
MRVFSTFCVRILLTLSVWCVNLYGFQGDFSSMPTYEYECRQCGHQLEAFQSITAAPLKKCPSCGKSALRRLLGAGAGIIFKGTGFYQTDYRPAKMPGGKTETGAGATDKQPAVAEAAKA